MLIITSYADCQLSFEKFDCERKSYKRPKKNRKFKRSKDTLLRKEKSNGKEMGEIEKKKKNTERKADVKLGWEKNLREVYCNDEEIARNLRHSFYA